MATNADWPERVFLASAVGLLSGVVLATVPWPTHILGQQVEWATWVQTVVASIAICGAWIGIRRQVGESERVRRKARRDMQAELAVIAFEVAAAAADSMKSSTRKIETGVRHIPVDRLDDVQETIRIFLAKDLPLWVFLPLTTINREIAYQKSAIALISRNKNELGEASRKARSRTAQVIQQTRHISRLNQHFIKIP